MSIRIHYRMKDVARRAGEASTQEGRKEAE